MMKFLFYICLIGLVSLPVMAQDKEELEKRKVSTLKEIEMARELLDQTQDKKRSSIRRVAVLNRGIKSRETLISTIVREIDEMDVQIDILEDEIQGLQNDISTGKQEYAHILRSVYINHTEEEKMMFLLASEDLNQFYQRLKYLKYLTDYRERKVEELKILLSRQEARTDELLRARNEKASLLESKEKENRSLVRERSQRNNMIRQLAQDEKRIRKEIEEKERIRKELEEKIRKMIEEETRRTSGNSVITSLTPEQKLVGSNFLQNKGRLPWPVDRGVVTAEFGLIDHPVLSGVKISNNGIDISTNPGTTARAVFDGEVTSVFAILGANYAVIIRHGEYLSVYQNLVELKVKAGDKVVTKQEIGTVHSNAEDGITELQFQVWKSKEILDPSKWLSK